MDVAKVNRQGSRLRIQKRGYIREIHRVLVQDQVEKMSHPQANEMGSCFGWTAILHVRVFANGIQDHRPRTGRWEQKRDLVVPPVHEKRTRDCLFSMAMNHRLAGIG